MGSLKREGTSYHPLLEQFKDITIGIGCYNAHEISLPLKPDSKPVAASASRIPIPLQAKVKAELDRLTEAGVFEDIPVDDNTQFINWLLPVPKKIPGSDELGVRLTMDWRELNRCLDAVHQEVPTFDQLRHDLNGARVFSKLDLSSAFFQFKLDHKSSRLTTFLTPWGLKHSTRLVQGAKPSAAICHEIVRCTLQGISHALTIYDDILVWGCGSTQEEAQKDHNFNLRQVFEVFPLKGLTINKEKCKFSATKIKFFGFMVSKDGFSSKRAMRVRASFPVLSLCWACSLRKVRSSAKVLQQLAAELDHRRSSGRRRRRRRRRKKKKKKVPLSCRDSEHL